MAAPKQMLYRVDDDDTTTSSLMESIGEIQNTIASLHFSVGELINSMAEILKSMTEMKSSLPPPKPPVVSAVEEEKEKLCLSRYIQLKKPQIEIPIFDGENVNQWILLAERYFSLGDFTETEKLRLTNLSLDGPALIWFNLSEDHLPFLDWDDFKSQVIVRFGGFDSRSAIEKLLNLKQEGEEEGSVVEYLEKFEELVVMVKDWSKGLFLECVFVNGLKDEIKSLIPLLQPKGLSNIVLMARRLEKSRFCRLLNSDDGDDGKA